tara:strand:- start:216 stop:716 length:501 start_codon:yes stop_codon:yes gene_type:complete
MEKNIYNKIFALRNEIGAISKDADNPFYKSKYFDINKLINQLNPLLQKHKLCLIQPIIEGYVKSVIVDLDGGSIESSLKLTEGLDAQKKGSEITYYRRYTLTSLLGLQAEDDDGNSAKQNKDWLVKKKDITNCQNAILSGKFTINDIKSKWNMTKEIENKLININK